MSRTLNLFDRLFARAQSRYHIGREQDAFDLLTQITKFRQLPGDIAEKTQALLAEIYLHRGRLKRARRCLTAALAHRPEEPRYHYLMAAALDGDENADLERAALHYARSLELDPDQPRCLSESGLLCVELGKIKEGLAALRRAHDRAPRDPEILQNLVSGLCLAERHGEARTVLLAARFRNPRDLRFRKLWEDYRFQEAHREQESSRGKPRTRALREEGPVILPFIRLMTEPKSKKVIREDPPAPLNPPHTPRPARRSDSRRAR